MFEQIFWIVKIVYRSGIHAPSGPVIDRSESVPVLKILLVLVRSKVLIFLLIVRPTGADQFFIESSPDPENGPVMVCLAQLWTKNPISFRFHGNPDRVDQEIRKPTLGSDLGLHQESFKTPSFPASIPHISSNLPQSILTSFDQSI